MPKRTADDALVAPAAKRTASEEAWADSVIPDPPSELNGSFTSYVECPLKSTKAFNAFYAQAVSNSGGAVHVYGWSSWFEATAVTAQVSADRPGLDVLFSGMNGTPTAVLRDAAAGIVLDTFLRVVSRARAQTMAHPKLSADAKRLIKTIIHTGSGAIRDKLLCLGPEQRRLMDWFRDGVKAYMAHSIRSCAFHTLAVRSSASGSFPLGRLMAMMAVPSTNGGCQAVAGSGRCGGALSRPLDKARALARIKEPHTSFLCYGCRRTGGNLRYTGRTPNVIFAPLPPATVVGICGARTISSLAQVAFERGIPRVEAWLSGRRRARLMVQDEQTGCTVLFIQSASVQHEAFVRMFDSDIRLVVFVSSNTSPVVHYIITRAPGHLPVAVIV